MESLLAAWKLDRSCQKVSHMHLKTTEVDGKSHGGVERSQKSTEGVPPTGKVDGIGWKVSRWLGKLTEFDKRYPGHMKG